MRSWLLVPGLDSPTLTDSLRSGADAVVIDLPASLPERKDEARRITADFLKARKTRASGQAACFVQIHGFSSNLAERDLDAVMAGAPDGIVLSATRSAADIQRLDVMIAVREAMHGLPEGETGIVAMLGDTAEGIIAAASGRAFDSPRLLGLAWSMPGLAADLGAERLHDAEGRMTDALRFGRTAMHMAAAAAGIAAIDSPSGLLQPDRLQRDCREAKADGFEGKFALHPAQLPIINALFSPTMEEIDTARKIVGRFSAPPSGPLFAADGSVLAQKDLARARRFLQYAPGRNNR